MRGKRPLRLLLLCSLLSGCGREPDAAPPPAAAPTPVSPSGVRIGFVDAEGRPLREPRVALLPPEAFDEKGRLRDAAVEASPDRVRVAVEDPAPGAPGSVTVSGLSLPLSGRLSKPFLILADKDDAAAGSGAAIHAVPGAKLELRYRGADAGSATVGPTVVHQIPLRVVVAGLGLPPAPEIEKALALRIAQANAVWEPLGRRFSRGPVTRLETFPGLFLIRGRAAGSDDQGRPSRCGVLVDGREISVTPRWRNDGAPTTPKATAAAWAAKAGKTFRTEILDGRLAGDREAVVVRVRRPDGAPALVEKLGDGNDVAQALTPLPSQLHEGIEVSAAGDLRSLEEMALLEAGKGDRAGGVDLFIVAGLRSLQSRPSYKVHPGGIAIMPWTLVDGSGRYPYGLARVLGEMLLPPGVEPAPGEDSLFADPLSEGPGVGAHKRVTAATGTKIAERGRGLSGKK